MPNSRKADRARCCRFLTRRREPPPGGRECGCSPGRRDDRRRPRPGPQPQPEPGAARAAPLSAGRRRAAQRGEVAATSDPRTMWTDVGVVAATGSTNEDVLAQAAGGVPEGLVIAAEAKTAGKGRLGRTWQAQPGSALTFSVLLRPDRVAPSARGWGAPLAGGAPGRPPRPGAGGR